MQPRFTRHKNIHSRKCIVQKSLRSIEKLYPRTADKDIPRIRYKANWSRENMIVSYKQPLYIDLTFTEEKKKSMPHIFLLPYKELYATQCTPMFKEMNGVKAKRK